MSSRNITFCNNCKSLLKGKITIIYVNELPYVAYCRTCMKGMNMNEYLKSLDALRKSNKSVESVDIIV